MRRARERGERVAARRAGRAGRARAMSIVNDAVGVDD